MAATVKDLFGLAAKAAALAESLQAAGSVNREFEDRVRAMYNGTGDPITPDQAQRYTDVIKDIEANAPHQASELAKTCKRIGEIMKELGLV